jgi:membrane protein
MKAFFKRILAIAGDAFDGWVDHKAQRMGAALSYYTAFSIGPMLLIAIAITGFIFGQDAARNHVFEALRHEIGSSAATVVQEAVKGAAKPASSIIASIVGVIVLLFAASGVFGELHDAMNTIWGVKMKENQGLKNFIVERFMSFAMVLGTGFLLLVSFVTTAILSAVGSAMSERLPGGEFLWQVVNFVLTFGIITLLFASLFKYVADIRVRWREVLMAGAVTSLLFSLGKLALGLYIGKTGVESSYGAASSLIVLLVWVYYSSQILYFGAELARALTVAAKVKVVPARGAVEVDVTPGRDDEPEGEPSRLPA